MNKPKVSPNISQDNAVERGQKKRQKKRVSFEKERDFVDGTAVITKVYSPCTLLSAVELKPAMKPQAKENECNHKDSKLVVVIPPRASVASQHEEKSRTDVRRRRVKSMPVGSATSQDFFGISVTAPSSVRKGSLDPLHVLHEDRIVEEKIRVHSPSKQHTDSIKNNDEHVEHFKSDGAINKPTQQQSKRVPSNETKSADCSCIIL